MVISVPVEALWTYGDFLHFFQMTRLGSPFLDFWVEFPPLFPYLSNMIALVASGNRHIYAYLLIAILTLAQAGSLYILGKLAFHFRTISVGYQVTLLYMGLLIAVPYGWWYFDAIAVFFMLSGISAMFGEKPIRAGILTGLGALTKWFPLIILVDEVRKRRWKSALWMSAAGLGLVGIVWLVLYSVSPDFTYASLTSQLSKGSWETIWALLDGNLGTGNFGPEIERYDPRLAAIPRGNPPVISPWITLAVFVAAGVYSFIRIKGEGPRTSVAFIGLTYVLFFLWSPGWSPQWILYLIPFTLLALTWRRAVLFSVILILISIVEWPILLSRGRVDFLWIPVAIRSIVLILLAIAFGCQAKDANQEKPNRRTD